MNEQINSFGKNIWSMLGNPISLKVAAIGALTLLLLVPVTMIESLIQEREDRQKEVLVEIGSKWGGEQAIIGPIISIPYRSTTDSVLYMHFLPETLRINGEVYPQVRYRGIFEAVLYNAKLVLTGTFSLPKTKKLKLPAEITDRAIEWSRASICVGFSDMRGITEPIVAKVNENKSIMNPGLDTNDLMSSGVSAGIVLERETKVYSFKFEVNLTGSDRINFIPVGKSTTVSLSSQWPNPSFCGAYLPTERSVNEKGFTATWKVLDFNRDYPQQWVGNIYRDQAEKSSFGVGLFTPVDFYQKSMRTTKYAILFVVLTFVAFFISEIVAKVRLHPVQYLLIGLAIIAFYALLFSLSEHIYFGTAYAISSMAVIVLVTVYARSILKKPKLAIVVGGVLAIVYAYSYWLLQMVDYALVVGSVGLFMVLSIIMFVTRNIDWYSIKVGHGSDA